MVDLRTDTQTYLKFRCIKLIHKMRNIRSIDFNMMEVDSGGLKHYSKVHGSKLWKSLNILRY